MMKMNYKKTFNQIKTCSNLARKTRKNPKELVILFVELTLHTSFTHWVLPGEPRKVEKNIERPKGKNIWLIRKFC